VSKETTPLKKVKYIIKQQIADLNRRILSGVGIERQYATGGIHALGDTLHLLRDMENDLSQLDTVINEV